MDLPKNVPNIAPDILPLKLITMTINFYIGVHLNLDVVARYTPINPIIKGIKYRDIQRGSIKPQTDPEAGRFKNQCTFVIDVGTKDVNTKLFNNGKMVTVGCKTTDHVINASQILTQVFQDMEGLVTYEIPKKLPNRNIKKFYKDELRKKYAALICYLAIDLQLDLDLEPFSSALSHEEGFVLYNKLLQEDDKYESDLSYIYTVISILKHYYEESDFLIRYQDPYFQELLKSIREGFQGDHISCVLPAYLGHNERICLDDKKLEIVLINKSTNCGYYINRNILTDILQQEPNVMEIKFDKNRYPGVITTYDVNGKAIKIIFFNTGKINITAAKTHEQVDIAYKFITRFCAENFSKLLLVTEYQNKVREYDEKLPDQHYVGQRGEEGHHYYLLKKTSITSNPRNVRYLNLHNLLHHYII